MKEKNKTIVRTLVAPNYNLIQESCKVICGKIVEVTFKMIPKNEKENKVNKENKKRT